MLRELEPLATSGGAYAFAVLLGLLWGSFANVCVYRWPPSEGFPKGRSVVAPGSHCFACQTPIRWYDNVPLLSWLWLRGKCRSCKAPFSARYLIVEAVTGLLFGLAWFATIETGALTEAFDLRLARFAIYATFCFVMVVITFIDLDHKLILDKITLPSIVIFYGLGLVLGRTWHHGLIGAAIGYGLPWSIGEIYWILTDREGLGLGDSKLLAVIGALLGATGVVASLFGGAVVGAVVGVFVLLRAPGDRSTDAADAPRSTPMVVVCSVVAVASVVLASIGGLLGWFWVALPSAVVSIVALIAARRFEPHAVATEPEPAEPMAEEPASQVGGRELAIRVLALCAGAGVLFAVTGVLLGTLLGAAIAGAVGLALLFVARFLRVAQQGPPDAEAEPLDSQEDVPSLMRTELPFGPFLAAAAVFYLFAEPWIVMNFRL